MYFIGYLEEARVIKGHGGFYRFSIVDKHAVKDEYLHKYQDKPYFWKILRTLPDRKGNLFCICEPMRPASEEELHMSYQLEEMLNEDYYWNETNKLLSQIGNIEEYIKAGFDDAVIHLVSASDEQYIKNVKYIRRCIVSKMAPLDKLEELIQRPYMFDFSRVKLYTPTSIPGVLEPRWADRTGMLVEPYYDAEEHGLFYIFDTDDNHNVALTQAEVFEHASKFDLPVAITVCDHNLLFMPDLSKNPTFKPIRRIYFNHVKVEEVNTKREFVMADKYYTSHMELFPGFEIRNGLFLPKADTPFDVVREYCDAHNELTPRDEVEIHYPSLGFETRIPASQLYAIRDKCLNFNIQKYGDTLENLKVIFDVKYPQASKTSLF